MFLHKLHQRLIDCSAQDRHEQGSKSMKSEECKHFNTMLNVELYISFNLPFYIGKAVAEFRCSNNTVRIEVGRHARIPRE